MGVDGDSLSWEQRLRGPTLYKYLPLGGEGRPRVERLLTRGELYWARRSQLNDPFECRARFSLNGNEQEYRRYVLDRLSTHWPDKNQADVPRIVADLLRKRDSEQERGKLELQFREGILSSIDRGLGILSLTDHPDDSLMWSHYADKHSGVCVGFHSNDIPSFVCTAWRVVYMDCPPLVEFVKAPERRFYHEILLSKSKAWVYEREWRDLDQSTGPGVRLIPRELICDVVLGALISPTNEKLVRDWASGLRPGVRMRKMALNDEDYGMTLQELGPA